MAMQLGNTTLRDHLRQFVREAFLLEPGVELADDLSLLGSGILDSTGVLELVTHLEDEYGLEIADDEIIPENLDSIDRLCRFVGERSRN